MRAAPLIAAAAACLPAAALACEITMPSCVSPVNGRLSSAYINPPDIDDVALFNEYDAEGQSPETLYLVECRSRQAVKMKLPKANSNALWTAYDYLTNVVMSDEPVTLQDIRDRLKGLGFQPALIQLPAGHCGCELAKMETIGCGDFGP